MTVNGSAVMATGNPAKAGKPWSRLFVALLTLTALVSSIPCLLAAPVAFALSDQDDACLLVGVGGTHLFLSWTIFGTI